MYCTAGIEIIVRCISCNYSDLLCQSQDILSKCVSQLSQSKVSKCILHLQILKVCLSFAVRDNLYCIVSIRFLSIAANILSASKQNKIIMAPNRKREFLNFFCYHGFIIEVEEVSLEWKRKEFISHIGERVILPILLNYNMETSE